MINRIFGWLFTLAALAVVVFAVLNRGNYSSMCFNKDCEAEEVAAKGVNEIEELAVELPDVADDMEAEAEADAVAPVIDADTAIVQ